jgi:hypothetical protein
MGIDDNDGNKLVFARGYGPGQGIAPALAIDSSDRVTMPSQPAFSALGPYPGNIYLISVSAGSGYVILWQGTYINVGSHYSTSTGRFTAPVAGNYMFQLSITNSGTGAGPIGFIRKNGSSVAQCAAYSVAYSTASVTVILPLAVNDYVDAYFAAFNVAAGIDLSYSNFCGHLIG